VSHPNNRSKLLPWELEFDGPAANRSATHENAFPESAREHGQQLKQSEPRIETLAQLLPEIVVSPATPQRLQVNLAANVLRDALPVHGLDLSQHESEIDEGAISGDGSEGEGGNNSSGEDRFEC
jgi:hypothetical protein